MEKLNRNWFTEHNHEGSPGIGRETVAYYTIPTWTVTQKNLSSKGSGQLAPQLPASFPESHHEDELRELILSAFEDNKNFIGYDPLDYIPKILMKISLVSADLTDNILALLIDNIKNTMYENILYNTLEEIWEAEGSFGNLSNEILVLSLVSLKNKYDAIELFERIMSLF